MITCMPNFRRANRQHSLFALLKTRDIFIECTKITPKVAHLLPLAEELDPREVQIPSVCRGKRQKVMNTRYKDSFNAY
jgi:hypothetical protein